MEKTKSLTVLLVVTLLSFVFSSCSKDDEEGLSSGSNSSKISLSLKANSITSYTATIKVSGASAADVTVVGIKVQPSSSTGGYKPSQTIEAGSHTNSATCNFTVERGTTYYVYAYANVNGNRIESSKQTLQVRK